MARREADFDACNLADQVIADDFGRAPESALRALPRTGLPDASVLLDSPNDGLLFGYTPRERFFAVNVFFVVGGLDGDQGVPGVRHRQHHCIDVLAGHHFAEIVIGLAVLVFIVLVDGVDGGLEMVLVEVTSGNDLAILELEELCGVARPLHPPANYTQGNALGGSRLLILAERAGRNNGRCGKRQPRGGKKTTSVHSHTARRFIHSYLYFPQTESFGQRNAKCTKVAVFWKY